jgi:4-hydroxy-tetrahydrodipicolinate synthase
MLENVRGVIPALVTPFLADGSNVDFISLRKLIEHVQRGGVKCVVACGSTGEAVALSDREYAGVVKATRETLQGTLIVGCGASATARTIELGKLARDAGAEALLVVNPPYNKPTAAGLVAHYTAVRREVGLPIIAYNVPGRTGANLPPDVVVGLATDGVIWGLKESSGSIDQFTELAARVPKDFVLLSGEDGLILPSVSLGARGVISVAGNAIPERVRAVFDAVERGDWSAARTAQLALVPIVKALFSESNPIPVKALLKELGVIASDALRLPLLPASESTRGALLREMR